MLVRDNTVRLEGVVGGPENSLLACNTNDSEHAANYKTPTNESEFHTRFRKINTEIFNNYLEVSACS